MSRDLPERPNLDHLKKQAKALLRKLREDNATATLADAQHTLAREYGFASWPKLKTHLEALPQGAGDSGGHDGKGPAAGEEAPRPPLFPRFTPVSRRALFFSRYEASQAGRLRIRPEHVLLGVIRGAGGATRSLLAGAGITLDDARAAVVDPNEPREVIVEPVEIPFQIETKQLFTAVADEADRLGHEPITTAHVVLGLLHEPGPAAAYLSGKGITDVAARDAAVRAAEDEPSDNGLAL